jgi:hypothetical protein
LILAGALLAILGILAVIAVVIVRRRNEGEDMWGDSLIEDPTETVEKSPDISPSGPPPGVSGEMRDGYEVLEYPENSGEWWWRDPSSGKWEEWSS